MSKINIITKRTKFILLSFGILAILTGFPYVLSLYGPTEVEVRKWGYVMLIGGVLTILISCIKETTKARGLKIFLVVFITFAQGPPIALWLAFHGSGISDGSPQTDFIAHWGFSIPHILIFILGVFAILSIKSMERIQLINEQNID